MTMAKHIERRTVLKGALASVVAVPAITAAKTAEPTLDSLIEQHRRLLGEWDAINDQLNTLEADPTRPRPVGVYEHDIYPRAGFGGLSGKGVWHSEEQIAEAIDPLIANLERSRDGRLPGYVASQADWVQGHQDKIDIFEAYKANAIAALREAQAPRVRWLRENNIAALESRGTELAGETWELEARIAAYPCRTTQDIRTKAAFFAALIEGGKTDVYDHFPAFLISLVGLEA